MKRTDLIALAPLLADGAISKSEAQRLADFLSQIAQAQPVAWRVEVRWTDITRDNGRWLKYADYATEKGAKSSQQRFSNPGDIEGRVVPLYTLPLED